MIVNSHVTTTNVDRWAQLASALGASVQNNIAEFAGGRMILSEGEPSFAIELETQIASLPEITGLTRHGGHATVSHEAMPDLQISERTEERHPSGDVHVAPLICTPDVETIAILVEDLGLKRRLTSDQGRYADLVADGILAVHIGTADHIIGFEASNIEDLIPPLEQAGFRATLIDENYGRTLRIEHPDDPSQEAEIWINETQTDTYGYSTHN